MAHELELLENGEASMAFVGDEPWHGLGFRVSNNLSPQEMLVAAKCDWGVEKHPNYVKVGDDYIPTGTMALVRDKDNKILAPNVGPGWEPLQNHEAFEFFADFVKAGSMEMHTAGSLQGGQIVWALAKVNQSCTVFKNDRIESHLLFSASHKYGKSHNIDWTAIRVVCMNTLVQALSKKSNSAVTVNHSVKFDPERVKELLGIANIRLENYKEAAEYLGSKKVHRDDSIDYLNEIFPIGGENRRGLEMSKNATRALELIETQPGAEFAPGTWWPVYNAVTYMIDHEMCRERDTRLFNSWLGGLRQTKVKALQLALDMA